MATSKSNRTCAAQPLNSVAVAYPGPAGTADLPFRTADGLPLGGALKEAETLLDAASEQLNALCESLDSASLNGVKFIVDSAGAIVSGLSRGFEDHPLSTSPDGYHFSPESNS